MYRFSGLGSRIEPDDDCCVPPPNGTPNDWAVTTNPPVNNVNVACDLPQTFPVISPDSDDSSEKAVAAVREFPAVFLAPLEVDILRPEDGRRVCGEELGVSGHRLARRRTVVPGVLPTSVSRVTLRSGARSPAMWWKRGKKPGRRRLGYEQRRLSRGQAGKKAKAWNRA